MSSKEGFSVRIQCPLRLSVAPENDSVISTCCVQIKNLSEQELAKFWSMYVKELAVLLVAVEGTNDPPPQVAERIKALVQEELLHIYVR